jgi:hypothetical protein
MTDVYMIAKIVFIVCSLAVSALALRVLITGRL